MNVLHARRLLSQIPDTARVVDVGGGASPFARADYVIDAIPFAARASLGTLQLNCEPRYTAQTWCQLDLCEHRPWPFPDKFFDFATCSHLLEDVRDPIWICSELCRIAKAGYIEVPSRIVEQSLGMEHPSYAGYYHHRWLVSQSGEGLEFRHKPHLLHVVRAAIVASVGVVRRINDEYSIVAFDWTGEFEFREVLQFDEDEVVQELCEFARRARQLPDLTVPCERTYVDRFKRMVYFHRLRTGRR